MPLAHVMKVPEGVDTKNNRGNPPYECIRHYFFDMGQDSLWAFFEIPKGEKKQTDRNDLGGLQHVAFAVTSTQFESIQGRLKEQELDFDGPVETLPGIFSIYFLIPMIFDLRPVVSLRKVMISLLLKAQPKQKQLQWRSFVLLAAMRIG
jgi:hypothetical protein